MDIIPGGGNSKSQYVSDSNNLRIYPTATTSESVLVHPHVYSFSFLLFSVHSSWLIITSFLNLVKIRVAGPFLISPDKEKGNHRGITEESQKTYDEYTNFANNLVDYKQLLFRTELLEHGSGEHVLLFVLTVPLQEIGDNLWAVDVLNVPIRPRNGFKIFIPLNGPLAVQFTRNLQ